MSEGNSESPERTPRYHCHNAPAVSIALERGNGADQVKAPADLLDISSDGAKICVPVPVESDEEIRLRIKHHDSGLNLPIPAAVRWVQHVGEATWRLGCSFLTPLPEDTLQTLASLGCLECTDLARLPVVGEAAAWKELDPSALSVQLVDLSRGGLSLISPQPAVLGQRMRLVSDGPGGQPTEVFVNVRCCAEVAQGYLIGCQFQDNRVYETLRGAVAPDAADQQSKLLKKVFRQSQVISRTTILILGGVFIGMAIRTPQPFFIMVLALVSVVAYLALELVAQSRLRSANSRWSQFFAELIEQRLEDRLQHLQGGWTTRPMIAMSAERSHDKPKRPEQQETGRPDERESGEVAAAAAAGLAACAAGRPELASAFDNDKIVT